MFIHPTAEHKRRACACALSCFHEGICRILAPKQRFAPQIVDCRRPSVARGRAGRRTDCSSSRMGVRAPISSTLSRLTWQSPATLPSAQVACHVQRGGDTGGRRRAPAASHAERHELVPALAPLPIKVDREPNAASWVRTWRAPFPRLPRSPRQCVLRTAAGLFGRCCCSCMRAREGQTCSRTSSLGEDSSLQIWGSAPLSTTTCVWLRHSRRATFTFQAQ